MNDIHHGLLPPRTGDTCTGSQTSLFHTQRARGWRLTQPQCMGDCGQGLSSQTQPADRCLPSLSLSARTPDSCSRIFLFPMAWLSRLHSQLFQAPSNLSRLTVLPSSCLPCHSTKSTCWSWVSSSFGSKHWLFAAGSCSESLRDSLSK